MSISVLNTDAGLSGKTIINLEDSQTITGAKTFDRDPNAPFVVTANSAVVPNLIAESLSGGTVAATTGTFSSTLAVTGLITGRDVTVVTSTTTGATNNWAPGIVAGTTLIEASGAALAATGLDGGTSGCVVIIKNTGSGTLTFAHNSGSSDADNRFQNMATSAATPVAAGGHVIYVHDGTDWEMVAHEQGAWITPTFAAGDYTAATGTWTVDSGDVTTCKYRLNGKTLQFQLLLASSDVSNSAAPIRRAVPGGFTISGTTQSVNVRISDAGGASVVGLAVISTTATTYDFYATVGGGNFTATSGDNTSVICNLEHEVS